MLSLVVSLIFVTAIKYVSENPDAVSTSIMLTTLFFSLLRSGFTFNVLSSRKSDSNPVLCLTVDKPILALLVFLYSQHLGVTSEQAIYTLFTASILTLIYRKQYHGYTRGLIASSLAISFIFPIQVTINLIFDYYQPELLFILTLTAIALYLAYDRIFATTDKMGLVEVYYSLLLPIGGFSGISIDGIDKPLYIIISKVVDSASTVASFIIQGDLKNTRAYVERSNIILFLTLAAATIFTTGSLLYIVSSDSIYKVISAAMTINLCWFTYSMFTIIFLIKYGTAATRNIYGHILCFGTIMSGLFIFGYFEPIYIITALSASFVFSMLMAKSTST